MYCVCIKYLKGDYFLSNAKRATLILRPLKCKWVKPKKKHISECGLHLSFLSHLGFIAGLYLIVALYCSQIQSVPPSDVICFQGQRWHPSITRRGGNEDVARQRRSNPIKPIRFNNYSDDTPDSASLNEMTFPVDDRRVEPTRRRQMAEMQSRVQVSNRQNSVRSFLSSLQERSRAIRRYDFQPPLLRLSTTLSQKIKERGSGTKRSFIHCREAYTEHSPPHTLHIGSDMYT